MLGVQKVTSSNLVRPTIFRKEFPFGKMSLMKATFSAFWGLVFALAGCSGFNRQDDGFVIAERKGKHRKRSVMKRISKIVAASLERVDMLVFRGEFWKEPVKP